MNIRRGWVIVLATASFALAAFAVVVAVNWVSNPVGGHPIAYQPDTNGVVSGRLFVQVGPRPATPVSGKVALVNVAQIGGAAAYSPPWVTTSPDGTFSVSVAPGTYQMAATVTGTSPFYRGGRRTCHIPRRTVRVHAGDHVDVNVQCQTGWP